MKFRLTVQNEFVEKLDNTCFTSEDFDLRFGDTNMGDDLVDITFIHDRKFDFRVFDAPHGFYIEMKPGQMTDLDSFEVGSIQDVLGLLPNWAIEVRNELKAGGISFAEIDKLRDLITEQLGEQTDDEEFSVEEINSFRHKFSELEKRVVQLEKDQIITRNQLNDFNSGIKQVSDDIEYYPKKTWLKTAPNKIVKLVVSIGKSKEGRRLLTDGARRLLGLE